MFKIITLSDREKIRIECYKKYILAKKYYYSWKLSRRCVALQISEQFCLKTRTCQTIICESKTDFNAK